MSISRSWSSLTGLTAMDPAQTQAQDRNASSDYPPELRTPQPAILADRSVPPPSNGYGSYSGDNRPSNRLQGNKNPEDLSAQDAGDRGTEPSSTTAVVKDRSQKRRPSAQSRVCGKCGQPLLGQFVRALGGTYHLECFTCNVSDMDIAV